jgi:hypothetical protein
MYRAKRIEEGEQCGGLPPPGVCTSVGRGDRRSNVLEALGIIGQTCPALRQEGVTVY